MRTAADKRIDDILAQGITLRFEGRVFGEKERVPGTGPTYKVDDVLRRVRAGRAIITSVGTNEHAGFEIEVRKAPQRALV